VCEGAGFRPRQFEYNPHCDPHDPATLVFGTIKGEVVVARVPGEEKRKGQGEGDEQQHPLGVVASFVNKPFFLGKNKHDSILGCVIWWGAV